MNEEQKVNTDRARFPVKTKIAIVWLVISGVILVVGPQLALIGFTDYQERDQGMAMALLVCVPIAFLWILPCIFLLLRKKWAHIFAVILLSFFALASFATAMFFFMFGAAIVVLPVVAVPLVLIIVDRENYLEMVRQSQVGKNYISHNQPQQKLRL
jgi:hypothetical protein